MGKGTNIWVTSMFRCPVGVLCTISFTCRETQQIGNTVSISLMKKLESWGTSSKLTQMVDRQSGDLNSDLPDSSPCGAALNCDIPKDGVYTYSLGSIHIWGVKYVSNICSLSLREMIESSQILKFVYINQLCFCLHDVLI